MSRFHAFSQDAMKTTFTLRIRSEEPEDAAGVAQEVFTELEYLESKLNRYLEGSDIWQINHMTEGQMLYISEPCYECLKLAMRAYQETGGLFDITVGKQIEHLKKGASGKPPEPAGRIAIDPERPAVHCLEAGRELDLGGIGKGFALDQLKQRMLDWGIEAALLSSGASTQLSFGDHIWPIELCGDRGTHVLKLQNMAVSASGTGIQGSHIVAPYANSIDYLYNRLWITHRSAAMADAWSTAVMAAEQGDLEELALQQDIDLFVEDEEGNVVAFPKGS
jgi:thiamine biosynthesis lipoprotein